MKLRWKKVKLSEQHLIVLDLSYGRLDLWRKEEGGYCAFFGCNLEEAKCLRDAINTLLEVSEKGV